MEQLPTEIQKPFNTRLKRLFMMINRADRVEIDEVLRYQLSLVDECTSLSQAIIASEEILDPDSSQMDILVKAEEKLTSLRDALEDGNSVLPR
jgi:hypothetical protein